MTNVDIVSAFLGLTFIVFVAVAIGLHALEDLGQITHSRSWAYFGATNLVVSFVYLNIGGVFGPILFAVLFLWCEFFAVLTWWQGRTRKSKVVAEKVELDKIDPK